MVVAVADIELATSECRMSSKSSCPTECGPRGDIIPTLKTDEEQEAFSSKHLPHYSCFKSVNTSDDKLEEQAENTSGEPEKEVEDTSCDIKPQKEPENASCDFSEKEVAEIKEGEQTDDEEQTEAAVREDGDNKQKSKEIDHSSSLFNIAGAKSDDVDYQNSKPFEIPAPNSLAAPLTGGTPNIDMLAKGAKNRSQKSPGTKSPVKSPRELLQSVQLPPAASQQIYDGHAAA